MKDPIAVIFTTAATTFAVVLALMFSYDVGRNQQRADTTVDCNSLGKFRNAGRTFECKEVFR